MPRRITLLTAGLGLGSILVGSCTGASPSSDTDADLLWGLEEAYLRAHREADHDAILALWDERFLGWPSRLPAATGKEGGPDYLVRHFPEPRQIKQRIERQGIRFEGDVAILHYRVYSWVGDEATAQVSTSRLTHTWVKRGSDWRILGGMDWRESTDAASDG